MFLIKKPHYHHRMTDVGACYIVQDYDENSSFADRNRYLCKDNKIRECCYNGPSGQTTQFVIDYIESGWYRSIEAAIEFCKKHNHEFKLDF